MRSARGHRAQASVRHPVLSRTWKKGRPYPFLPTSMRYRARSNRAPAPASFEKDFAISPFNRPPLSLAELDAAHASYLEVARYVDEISPLTLKTRRSVYRRFRKYVLAGDSHDIPSRISDITGWLIWVRKSNERLSKVTVNSY